MHPIFLFHRKDHVTLMRESELISYEIKALRARMRSYARGTKVVRYSELERERARSTLLFYNFVQKLIDRVGGGMAYLVQVQNKLFFWRGERHEKNGK